MEESTLSPAVSSGGASGVAEPVLSPPAAVPPEAGGAPAEPSSPPSSTLAPAPDGEGDGSSSSPSPAPEPKTSWTREELEAGDHEFFKQFGAYNKTLAKSINDTAEKARAKALQDQRMAERHLAWAQVEQEGTAAQWAASSMEAHQEYEQVKAWRALKQMEATQPQALQAVATQMLQNFKSAVTGDDRFKAVADRIDALAQEAGGDVMNFLYRFVDAAYSTRDKELTAKLEREYQAKHNAALAKYGISVDEPDTRRGVAGGDGGFSWETLNGLTGAERKAYEQQHKATIEQALRESLVAS